MSAHAAFGDDDEGAGDRRRTLPKAKPTLSAAREMGIPEKKKEIKEGGGKGKKAARDFSSLLDEDVTYTPYIAPAEDGEAAEMMGFAGFGKQMGKEKSRKEQVRKAMTDAARRGVVAGGSADTAAGAGTGGSAAITAAASASGVL